MTTGASALPIDGEPSIVSSSSGGSVDPAGNVDSNRTTSRGNTRRRNVNG